MTATALFSNLSLRGKIALAIALVGTCVVAAGDLTYRSIQDLDAASGWTDHTYDVLIELGTLHTRFAQMESELRGYLLSGDTNYLVPEHRSGAQVRESFNELRTLTVDNTVQQKNIERLRVLIDERLAIMNHTMEAYQQGGLHTAVDAAKSSVGKSVTDKINAVLADMDAEERRLLMKRRDDEQASRNHNNQIIILSAVATAIFLAFIILLIRDDLEARARLRHAVERLALEDALTELPNRVAFHNGLAAALARAKRNNRKVAVLYFDLDGFKEVNDRYGHHAGDEVLRMVTRRLKKSIRASDILARVGGDEFVLMLDEIAGHAEAGAAAGKVIQTVSEAVLLDKGNEARVGASIGISFFPDDEVRPDQLIKLADDAMYRAKRAGKARFRFHTRYDAEE